MGQFQTKLPQPVMGDVIGLQSGDKFLYTIRNVNDYWQKMIGVSAGSRFNSICENPVIDLVYDGVIKDVFVKNNQKFYSYVLNKFHFTTRNKEGVITDCGITSRETVESNINDIKYYFGTDTIPPTFVAVKSNTNTYPSNYGDYTSLIPQYIPEGDANLSTTHQTSLMTEKQMPQFMNKYASLSMTKILSSHPQYADIVKLSEKYTSVSEIKRNYEDILSKYKSKYGNQTITVLYEGDKGLEKQTTSVSDFIKQDLDLVLAKNKAREYKGVIIDFDDSYESDYTNIKFADDMYNHRMKSTKGYEAIMPNVAFKGDIITTLGGKDGGMNGDKTRRISRIRSVGDDGHKLVMAEIEKLKEKGHNVSGWTQIINDNSGEVKIYFFSRIFPEETRKLPMTKHVQVVSGTTRGYDGYIETGTKRSYAENLSSTAISKHVDDTLVHDNKLIKEEGVDYLEILAMIMAYQRLNPNGSGYNQAYNTSTFSGYEASYKGCYVDKPERAITGEFEMTSFENCQTKAINNGSSYFALQDGGQCFISEKNSRDTDYAKYGASQSCSSKDEYGNNLGGVMSNAVYTLKPVSNPYEYIEVDQMWRVSEALKAVQLATFKSLNKRISDENTTETRMKASGDKVGEAFMNREYHLFVSEDDSPLDRETIPQREQLLDAVEKRDAIIDQLAGASTEATTQMSSFIVALVVFGVVSMLPSQF